MISLGTALGFTATALASAALSVSLLHAGPAGKPGPPGPRGAPGPAGAPGKPASATRERFGVCWEADYQTQNGVTWINSVIITPAQISNGVYECPQGETFTSVVPEKSLLGG